MCTVRHLTCYNKESNGIRKCTAPCRSWLLTAASCERRSDHWTGLPQWLDDGNAEIVAAMVLREARLEPADLILRQRVGLCVRWHGVLCVPRGVGACAGWVGST